MILDLPPNIEQIIITQAKEQGMTAEQWVSHAVHAHAKPVSVADFFENTKPLASFKNIDPLAYQKAVRDEWD
ncbi:MAG: hypothetical protein Q3971_03070 [Moraxella sp.]|nr:hypothetical protein [Moraxella sp.]